MYTISELATLSGVTTRTLRYYDEIGLVPASGMNSSGHRVYDQMAVDMLQRVLFYRELDVDLKTIQKALQDTSVSSTEILRKQYHELEVERDRLSDLLKILDETIQSHKGEYTMSDEEKFAAFKEKKVTENEALYGAEIRESYGDAAVDASNAKLMGMSEQTYQAFRTLEEDIKQDFLLRAVQTQNIDSAEAELLVSEHRKWLLYTWHTYTLEAHRGLADMYVADERFTSYYDDVVPGGTKFLRDAIYNWTVK